MRRTGDILHCFDRPFDPCPGHGVQVRALRPIRCVGCPLQYPSDWIRDSIDILSATCSTTYMPDTSASPSKRLSAIFVTFNIPTKFFTRRQL